LDYIIVSTSKCDYQAWQIKLLNWSRIKVGQKGKLLILLSEDKGHAGENANFDLSEDVEIIKLPDWAWKWKTEKKSDWGGIPNKFESTNWLVDNYPFKLDDILLFLDPDMIFLESVDFKPKRNQIIGQGWFGYRSLKKTDESAKAFMYPFFVRFSTLKKIAPDFKSNSIALRNEIKRWESDMWALDNAAKQNDINIQYVEDLGRCTVWQSNDDEVLSSIIHFPNEIYSKDSEILFFKQIYTYKRNQAIEIWKARNAIDSALLLNISQERTDYFYHIKWDFKSILKDYNGSSGYLAFTPWPGGFNNIRMSFELAVCLSYLTNRTLILPPAHQMYLLEGEATIEDFFDLENLGISYFTFHEFCSKKNIEHSLEALKSISTPIYETLEGNIINTEYIRVPKKVKKLDHWGVHERYIFFKKDEILFCENNLLGNFNQSLYTSFGTELKKLVAKHVVLKKSIFNLAWNFINKIGDQQFYAIHIRRNDYQFKELFIPCEEIRDHLAGIVPENATLYIATDHKDLSFFEPLSRKYNLVFYKDVLNQLDLGSINKNWIPALEMMICTRAIKFVGMYLSTFSSFIYRMRGYMADIADKNYYINGKPFDEKNQKTYLETEEPLEHWARDYKCIWDFKSETIFLAIASYADSQLIPTIKSALEGCTNPERLIIGVHIQDTFENYQELKALNLTNVKIVYTHKSEAKGMGWARNRIKDELFDHEDYFMQVDSHSRFRKNWDNTLIHQLNSIEEPKVIISTYPNKFYISDTGEKYLDWDRNTSLKFEKFLNEEPGDNRLRMVSIEPVHHYDVQSIPWCAGGLVFTKSSWLDDVKISDYIISNGEEELQYFQSFLKGYNLRVPSLACVYHNYDFKNDKTGVPYREFNRNYFKNDAPAEINSFLWGNKHERSVKELEKDLGIKLRYAPGFEKIYVSVAAYLDLDVRNTILDCIKKAKYPERLFFGVCWQYDESKNIFPGYLNDLVEIYNITVEETPISEAEGPGWARQKANQFYKNERFFLQIDAHIRFLQNWDDMLIKNHFELKKQTGKPVISFFPPHFYDDKFAFVDWPDYVNIPKVLTVSEDNLFEYSDRSEQRTGFKSIPIAVLDPSFIFVEGLWVEEVLPNPNIYYIGEDVYVSVDAFTKGYNFFSPKRILAWHKLSDPKTFKHYNTHPPEHSRAKLNLSLETLDAFIQKKSSEINSNSKRNLLDYEKMANVVFDSRLMVKPIPLY
jgi:hypothetical protein